MDTLWVIVPAFNEQEAIGTVLRSWSHMLRNEAPNHVLCVLNDGSTDGTEAVLNVLRSEIPTLRVVTKANSGHGQTCLTGYRLALENNVQWVLQIDSDGQCDPSYFPAFWSGRHRFPVQYGCRVRREDGMIRTVISSIVSLVVLLAAGVWVRDPNVPYRLMRADTLVGLVPLIPADVHLANVFLAALQQKHNGIRWIPITFLRRAGGTPSGSLGMFARRGWQLFRQLRSSFRAAPTSAVE